MSEASTTKAGRAVLKAIKPIVEAVGGKCWVSNPPGNKGHQRLMIEVGGAIRFTPLSGTPRLIDQAIKHKVSDVKKLLREMSPSTTPDRKEGQG